MKKLLGLVVLALGVLLLLRDLRVLGSWNFWNIQPWTLVFLLAGLVILKKACCCKGEMKKKR